jgi:hypothetical protein
MANRILEKFGEIHSFNNVSSTRLILTKGAGVGGRLIRTIAPENLFWHSKCIYYCLSGDDEING